jgi:hypothetical protein
MLVILPTQETEIRRIVVQKFMKPYLETTHYKKGLVEWLDM